MSVESPPTDITPPHTGLRRYAFVQFLCALILLIASSPFLEENVYRQQIEAALMTLLLLSGVLAVGARRRSLIAAIVLVIPAIASRWIHHFHPELLPRLAVHLTAVIFVIYAVSQLLIFVLRAQHIDFNVLCASISIYLMLGLIWALAYMTVSQVIPGSFTFNNKPTDLAGFDAFYFSFITLNTVGYGDIAPVSSIARMLAMFESTTGILYMAILIARLVAIRSSMRPD